MENTRSGKMKGGLFVALALCLVVSGLLVAGGRRVARAEDADDAVAAARVPYTELVYGVYDVDALTDKQIKQFTELFGKSKFTSTVMRQFMGKEKNAYGWTRIANEYDLDYWVFPNGFTANAVCNDWGSKRPKPNGFDIGLEVIDPASGEQLLFYIQARYGKKDVNTLFTARGEYGLIDQVIIPLPDGAEIAPQLTSTFMRMPTVDEAIRWFTEALVPCARDWYAHTTRQQRAAMTKADRAQFIADVNTYYERLSEPSIAQDAE